MDLPDYPLHLPANNQPPETSPLPPARRPSMMQRGYNRITAFMENVEMWLVFPMMALGAFLLIAGAVGMLISPIGFVNGEPLEAAVILIAGMAAIGVAAPIIGAGLGRIEDGK